MPKETISDQASMYDIHIGWSRDGGYVQIGVETTDGTPLIDRLAVAGPANPEAAHFKGLWGTLDRAGCNRAIRALRTARDAAFGRDE